MFVKNLVSISSKKSNSLVFLSPGAPVGDAAWVTWWPHWGPAMTGVGPRNGGNCGFSKMKIAFLMHPRLGRKMAIFGGFPDLQWKNRGHHEILLEKWCLTLSLTQIDFFEGYTPKLNPYRNPVLITLSGHPLSESDSVVLDSRLSRASIFSLLSSR